MSTAKVFIIVPVALLLLSGCEATRYSKLPEPATPAYNRANLIQVMQEMDARRQAVRTIVARMNIVLRDSVKNKQHGLNGAYLGDQAGNVRMQIRHGETTVIDVAYRGNTVDVWLPRKNRFYRGKRSDVMKATGNELSLIAHAGTVHDLFFPRAWTPHAVERRAKIEHGQEVVHVIERPGIFRRRVRRLVIDKEYPVADLVEVFNKYNKPLGSIRYADYHFPGPRAADKGEGTPNNVTYPGRVTLVTADGNRSLQMDVAELLINVPIPLDKYEIEVPEGQKILDLGKALRSGKSLWE